MSEEATGRLFKFEASVTYQAHIKISYSISSRAFFKFSCDTYWNNLYQLPQSWGTLQVPQKVWTMLL